MSLVVIVLVIHWLLPLINTIKHGRSARHSGPLGSWFAGPRLELSMVVDVLRCSAGDVVQCVGMVQLMA